VAARTALLMMAGSFGRIETEGIAVEHFSQSVIHFAESCSKSVGIHQNLGVV